MNSNQSKSDLEIMYEQRIIEVLRSATEQSLSMSKWLIATLMTTNTAGLYFTYKVTVEIGKSNHGAVFTFIAGGAFAMLTGLLAYLNFQFTAAHYQGLLFTPHSKRNEYLKNDIKGNLLSIISTTACATGILSMLSAGYGAYQITNI